MKHALSIAIGIMSLLATGCSSLVEETDRIRKLYEAQNGGSPTVMATDPADNSFAPHNQTYIDVTFSTSIDAGSFTAQSPFGACSGSFQVSYDGFTNCLGGTVDTSANPRIRFTPTFFPKGLGLQLRVTGGVFSSVGVTATPYTSPVGFRLAAPCGNQNCFFSHSTPLMTNAGGYSGIFRVRGGTHQGKYLVYTFAQSATTLIDPVAATSQAGPSMSPCAMPNNSTHNFLNNAGTKEVIIIGGSTTATCLFDHAANTFAVGPAFLSATGLGSYSFKPQNPASPEYGNTLVSCANNSAGVVRFAANDTGTGSVYALTGGNANLGAHAIRATAGSYAGKWIHFNSGTKTTIFTENPPAMSLGYTTGIGVLNGAISFEVFSGVRAGQVITIFGASSTNLFAYDLLADAAATTPTALSTGVNQGSLFLRQQGTNSYDAPVLLHGANTTASSIYDAAAGKFINGPLPTGALTGGSTSIFMPGSGSNGAFFIVNGSPTPSTSVYFPGSNSFHGSRTPGRVPDIGVSSFRIPSGTWQGRTLIVGGNAITTTAVYDPLTHQIVPGPDYDVSITPGTTSFAVPLTQGPNAGKVIVFQGATATYRVFDPATNAFFDPSGPWPGTTFTAKGLGATSFPINSTSYILVMNGGANTLSQKIDQSTATPTVTAGPFIGCAVNGTPFNLAFANASTGEVKQLVYCSTNTFRVFDHATQTFTVTVTVLGGSAGAGIQGLVIPTGPLAKQVLIIHGNNSSLLTLIDPTTLATSSVGTWLTSGCPGVTVGTGSQLLYLPYGANAGKYLLIAGGNSQSTCMFDPAGPGFSPGPVTNSVISPGYQVGAGAHAFKTGGGIYPLGYVVMSGQSKNVWSTYVP